MYIYVWAFQVVLVVKNPPANAEDVRDVGLIPGLERSPEEGMATHSSVLAWRIPWTEEPGGLQSIGLQSRTQLSTAQQAHIYLYINYMYIFSPNLKLINV